MEHAISLAIDVQPIFSTLMPLLDPADPRPIHLVGIAGAGMSALAELFLLRGARVTGCDAHPENAPDLVARGVEVLAGHSADHVAGAPAARNGSSWRPMNTTAPSSRFRPRSPW